MTEKKKSVENPLYDEDVTELADIYDQMGKVLANAEPKPTSEAVQALACTVMIKRNDDRLREEAKARRAESAASNAPSKVNAAPGGDERECPDCGTILQRKFPKDGRQSKGYFSCGKCKQFVNEDGTTKPWRNQ